MLTKRAKYAMKAMLFLAEQPPAQPALISEIAAAERIPRKFLEHILLTLKRAGLLRSRMGRGGGYLLARPATRITFGELVRLTDGPLAPVSCVSKTAYRPCEECADEARCAIRAVMGDVRDAIAEILDHTSLDDALRKVRRRRPGRGGRSA
jgi:Rrf2 family protein